MKKSIKTPAKIGMLFASIMLVCSIVSATTYTAVLSGNWSASATWGGTAPPFMLGTTDQVIIPLTINVTMDQNVTINGALASIDVLGTLSASPFVKLTDIAGTLSGAGSINAANIVFGAAAIVTPTSENLYVKNTAGTKGLVNVEIYNALGQLVSNFQSTNDLIAVPVNALASGTFLNRLYNDNMEVVKKFSKM